jgi:tetratricopeptide (TPR) repeat protein
MPRRARSTLLLLTAGVFVIGNPHCGSPRADHLQLAVAYLEVNRNEQALQEVLRARRESGPSAEQYLVAALAHVGLEQSDAAVDALLDGLSLSPDEQRLHAALREISVRQERLHRALAGMERLSPDSTATATALATLGWLRARTGDLEGALLPLQQAAATDSTPAIQLDLSDVLAQLGRTEEAAALLEKALRTTPDDPDLLLAAGLSQLRRSDEDGATASFDRVLTLSSDAAGLALRVAMSCHELDSPALAIQYYERALELGNDDPLALNNLAWTYAELEQRLPRALTLSTRAVKMEPDNAVYLDTYAEVCLRLGQRERAVAILRQALELNPADSADHDYLQGQLTRFRAALTP